MKEYKTAFKNKCTECILFMVNNDDVKHEIFYRQTRCIEFLYYKYVEKLKAVGSLIGYKKVFNQYTAKLDFIYKEAFNQ